MVHSQLGSDLGLILKNSLIIFWNLFGWRRQVSDMFEVHVVSGCKRFPSPILASMRFSVCHSGACLSPFRVYGYQLVGVKKNECSSSLEKEA